MVIDCSIVLTYDSQESIVLGSVSNTSGTRIPTTTGNTSEITPLRVQFAHAEIVEGTQNGVFNPGGAGRETTEVERSRRCVVRVSAVAIVMHTCACVRVNEKEKNVRFLRRR